MIGCAILAVTFALLQDDPSPGDTPPTPEAIIERYVEAKGGEEVLRSVRNYTMRGKIIYGNEEVAEFECHQATDRHLWIVRFPDGSTRSNGTDGKIAWYIDIDGNPGVLNGQRAADYMRESTTLHEALEWERQFDAILYAGIKTIAGTPAHHLIFVASDNRQINRYFSTESGLYIREEQVNGAGKEAIIIASEIGDYQRDESGVLVPRRRVNDHGSGPVVEYRITYTKSNALTDDSIFAVPEAVARLPGDADK